MDREHWVKLFELDYKSVFLRKDVEIYSALETDNTGILDLWCIYLKCMGWFKRFEFEVNFHQYDCERELFEFKRKDKKEIVLLLNNEAKVLLCDPEFDLKVEVENEQRKMD